MRKDNPHSPPEPSEPAASERLDSWKEIAAYLKREIRTVQRWEKAEGLPVRRHVHDRRGTVYAYTTEMDAWWNNRRPRLEQQEEQEQAKATTRRRRLCWAAAAIAAVVAVSGVGLWLAQPPPLTFQERDWVLITHFENRTGETLFDGTLEYALERELSNSRFVNVVPRVRVEDALRLMKKPPNTRVDAAVGREICLRDGAIRALLTGRVEKLGSRYILSASLIEPSTGTIVAGLEEEAESHEEVLPALRRLAHGVRRTLGEKLNEIRQSEHQLAKVTTPSLRALQLYTQADALYGHIDTLPQQQNLLREAIGEDPEFAMAHIRLAHVYRHLGAPPTVYQLSAKTAWELADSTTERERYFIRASYSSLMGQDEKAAPYWETLLRLYPDDYWAARYMADLSLRLGRNIEVGKYGMLVGDLRPNDPCSNIQAAGAALLRWETDRHRMQTYLARARAVPEKDIVARCPVNAAWLALFPAFEEWLQGNRAVALAETERVAATVDSYDGLPFDAFANYVGCSFALLGRLKETERLWGRASLSMVRDSGLAEVAFMRGDTAAFRKHLRNRLKNGPEPSYLTAAYLAQAGLLTEATQALRQLEAGVVNKGQLKTAQGELAFAHGRLEEAIPLLEEGTSLLRGSRAEIFWLGSQTLAAAWEQKGQLDKAAEVLERASREKIRIYAQGAHFWMRVQLRRAQLYRKMGRAAEAGKAEAELRTLLGYADPDHPILLQLNTSRSHQAHASVPTQQ